MTNLHKTGAAALITAAFLTLALLFTGCPQAAKPKPKHPITFSVDGTGGTLKATAGGSSINSGNEVEEGKTVTFTAKADAGYRLKGWTLDGNAVNGTADTYTLTVTKACKVTVSFEPKKALLTLAAGKNTVKVKAKTADGSAIKVEGCNVNELANEAETTLTVTDSERKLALIGDIIELDCSNNFITELDVQGLKDLQELYCNVNRLTSLNVQGFTALKELICNSNELSTLDVSGLTKLQELNCSRNQLTALDVSGLTALQELNCRSNKIPELNVQGLTKLQQLKCGGNQLTALDVSGLTALQKLYCNDSRPHVDRYLSELNVQGCTSLKELRCYYNKLDANAFIKIFNDLPTREVSDDAAAVLYATEISEGNCKNFSAPESLKAAFDGAKAKHWKMKKMAGYLDEDI